MRRGFGPIALFVALYMIVFGILAVRTSNAEFMMYGVAVVVFIGAILAIDRRVRFSMPVLWMLAVWGFLHMGGGTIVIGEQDGKDMVLYGWRYADWAPRYDQIVHAFGFFVATLASWEAIRAAGRGSIRATLGPVAAAVLCGLGLGAVNELLEFLATVVLENTGVGGYINTGWDLVSNTVGALIAGALILVRGR